MRTVNRAFAVIRPYLVNFWTGQLAMLIAAAAGVVLPLVSKDLIDSLNTGTFREHMPKLLMFLSAAFLVSAFANMVKELHIGRLSQYVVRDLREKAFANINAMHLPEIETYGSGTLVSVLTNDINVLQESITRGIVYVITQLLSLFVIVVLLARIDLYLTGALFAVAPVMVLTTRRASGRVRKVSGTVQQQLGLVTSIINEAIRGIDVIKAFLLRDQAQEILRSENAKVVSGSLRVVRLRAVNSFLVTILAGAALIGLITFGSLRASQGLLSIGELVAFLVYAQMIVTPIGMLSGLAVDIRKAFAAAERIFGVLDAPREVGTEPRESQARIPCSRDTDPRDTDRGAKTVAENPDHTKGGASIILAGCSFSYPDGTRGLQDVDLTLPAGDSLGVVGPSGAGKSTLLKLLLKFRSPTEGRILIDDADIAGVDVDEVREKVTAVLQDTHLFDMSVRDNILCGNPQASFDEVEHAARAANAHEFITRLPAGYDTVLGENGCRLSGGQRQRIAMARAFLKDAPILLLDEATSSLDTESERKIQEAFQRLSCGRTSIVVAHRIATVRHMDSILLLDSGRAVARGTHEQLLGNNRLYSDLCRFQMVDDLASERQHAG